jgi:hypothetical protein
MAPLATCLRSAVESRELALQMKRNHLVQYAGWLLAVAMLLKGVMEIL